jgi:hypothetical protein
MSVLQPHNHHTDDKRWARSQMLAKLKLDKAPKVTRRVLMVIPQASAHTGPGHLVSVESGLIHRISDVVKQEIYRIVSMGITTAPIVRKMFRFVFLLFYSQNYNQPIL